MSSNVMIIGGIVIVCSSCFLSLSVGGGTGYFLIADARFLALSQKNKKDKINLTTAPPTTTKDPSSWTDDDRNGVIFQLGHGQEYNNQVLDRLQKDSRINYIVKKGFDSWTDDDRNTAISILGGGSSIPINQNIALHTLLLVPKYNVLKTVFTDWDKQNLRNTAIVQNGGVGGENLEIFDSLLRKSMKLAGLSNKTESIY